MICAQRVVKTYRRGTTEVHVLNDISLQVESGEFLSIMGPSGSGKSTFLHLVGGLDRPTSGEIRVRGTLISTLTDDDITVFRRRHVGFVFQFFNLLQHLSAAENVAFPLLLDGVKPRQARERAAAMLDRVDLGHRATHRPADLSGGEMQRVAIARALVIEPLILLADEPTGNLDSRNGEEILALLRQTSRDSGLTILMVTHDPKAATYGDRTVIIRDGRVDEARSA
jgi:putative ABC transport system ATP-binding protein